LQLGSNAPGSVLAAPHVWGPDGPQVPHPLSRLHRELRRSHGGLYEDVSELLFRLERIPTNCRFIVGNDAFALSWNVW